MVDTQKVGNVWFHKTDFCAEDCSLFFDRFDIDEDIRDRAFVIDIWEAEVLAKPAREEDY